VLTSDGGWRTVADRNVRAGAVFALLAAVAGWRLALVPGMERSPLVEWHRWLGTLAAAATLAAALATQDPSDDRRSECGCSGSRCWRRERSWR